MVTNEKGGTGKTTLAVHIAGLLAARGQRVLLVDFDPQAHATLLLGIPESRALHDLLVDDLDIVDLLAQPEPERYAIPGQDVKGRLYVLPGGKASWNISIQIQDVTIFREHLVDVGQSVDVVVVDTAPSPGLTLTLPYRAADYVLIPTKAEFLSLDGVRNTIKAMNAWSNVKLLAVQPNLYRSQTDLHAHHLRQLREAAKEMGWPVWSPIAQRTIWSEAASMQRMIYTLPTKQGLASAEALRLVECVEKGMELI
jgi:chromosome partitioning protein